MANARTLTAAGTPAPAAAEERIEDTGEITKDILKVVEGGGVALAGRALNPGKAELVVISPFLLVGKNLVSLGGFLEFFLGGLVARVFIGVKLYG
jgi:hypothetical protein